MYPYTKEKFESTDMMNRQHYWGQKPQLIMLRFINSRGKKKFRFLFTKEKTSVYMRLSSNTRKQWSNIQACRYYKPRNPHIKYFLLVSIEEKQMNNHLNMWWLYFEYEKIKHQILTIQRINQKLRTQSIMKTQKKNPKKIFNTRTLAYTCSSGKNSKHPNDQFHKINSMNYSILTNGLRYSFIKPCVQTILKNTRKHHNTLDPPHFCLQFHSLWFHLLVFNCNWKLLNRKFQK
jgi:hypothetical protein